jgi:glucokinase
MRYSGDTRTVFTLDAGGTNFVFSAIRGDQEVVDPITLPAHGDDLDACLTGIVEGFGRVREAIPEPPAAISFAFPGPADYPAGIIGDLGNLPAFRGGVALGPMLAERFGVPVYLNNDGDLFAYGEAIAGLLPKTNELLEQGGSPKRFSNLIGVTLGTGFGCGIVTNGKLHLGDNSAGAEIWLMRSPAHPACIAEEDVSIRAVQREYARAAGTPSAEDLSAEDIYDIARGAKPGHREAANEAFVLLAKTLAESLASACTLIDGLVAIGGGLAGASSIILPRVVEELNGTIQKLDGSEVSRIVPRAFNLEDPREVAEFVKGEAKEIEVPGTNTTVAYDRLARTGIGRTVLGTSRAVALGAYAFALAALDREAPRHG